MDAVVAAAAAEEEAEWRGEGILEHVSSSTSILLKVAVFCECVAFSVLMYGVFRRFVVLYDAFAPGRVAGAVVLLLAAALIWREKQEERKQAENVLSYRDS